MSQQKQKRLLQSLTGHYHELLSVFSRSATHKLPSAKGILREDAVSKFITSWIPNRFTTITNVFATTRRGNELQTELDIVVHDSNSGAVWNLDADGHNSIATWEEIKLIVEVKSTLNEKEFNQACKSMSKVSAFVDSENSARPLRILFAYKVDEKFSDLLMEKFTYSLSDNMPFDAFILLEVGAFFSDTLQELRIGIENGLSPSFIANDTSSQNKIIEESCMETRIPNGYRIVSDGTNESTLLSLAVLSTFATAGDDTTQALLAACKTQEYIPINDKEFIEDKTL